MTSIRSFIRDLISPSKFITVVSGLPRSGTSMMMSALEKGGMGLVVDHIRTADANNPRGYYEFERVKKLPEGDVDWLVSANGKAVKIISALLTYLPEDYHYRVIFMERDLEEILASQNRMLERNSIIQQSPLSEDELARSFDVHLSEVKYWLETQDLIQTLYVSYNRVLCQPKVEFGLIAKFLDGKVDPDSMAQVVDPSLHREKSLIERQTLNEQK